MIEFVELDVIPFIKDYVIPISAAIVWAVSIAQNALRGTAKAFKVNQDDWDAGRVIKSAEVTDKALELTRAVVTGDWKIGKRIGQLIALAKAKS